MKKNSEEIIKNTPKIICLLIAAVGLLVFSEQATAGIRNGITLIMQNLIPSLFPFMVLSAYIVNSNSLKPVLKFLAPVQRLLFGMSADSFVSILMGFIGGYPVGAITTASLYRRNEISQNEAERLMLFSVNGGPAFLITAVGAGMLGNKKLGIMIYISIIISSLTIGIFLRFFRQNEGITMDENHNYSSEGAFTSSVAQASKSILGVAGWVLTFSCIGGLIDTIGISGYYSVFLKAALEITTGCRAAAGVLPVPVIAAAGAFGGIAVIYQIKPYTDECKVKIKKLLSFRLLNAALSAFICSELLRAFPDYTAVNTSAHIGGNAVFSAYSVPAVSVLLIMCVLFVLDVDCKRKVC